MNDKSESEMSSLCETLKEDTSEVLQKIESKIPSAVQNYSDLYTQYLHMMDDVFGTCFIAEKKILDKLNLEPKILEEIKKTSESIKKSYIQNIEMASNVFDEYTKLRIENMKAFDNYVHMWMNMYANTLSQWNKIL